MKKILIACIALVSCTGIQAQYKKASFFEKEGRTYGLNATAHMMGDGKGTVMGYSITFGRDRDGKRLFTNTDIKVLPSYKFSYEAKYSDDRTAIISGKSNLHIVYGTNWGVFLRNNEAEQIFKPYVTAGFNIVLLGGVKDYSYDDYSSGLNKSVSETTLSVGIGGGAGAIINLSKVIGIRLEGGYTYQYNLGVGEYEAEESYYMYTRHPYASVGLRFRVVRD